MSPENFVYWLNGFFELCGGDRVATLTQDQVSMIRDHLALVLKKETPSYAGGARDMKLCSAGPKPRNPLLDPHIYHTG